VARKLLLLVLVGVLGVAAGGCGGNQSKGKVKAPSLPAPQATTGKSGAGVKGRTTTATP
jgi:hypothetical protein